MSILQNKAKAIADILAANGVLPPPGMSVEQWKKMNPQPMSFEGAYLVILEALRGGGNFQLMEHHDQNKITVKGILRDDTGKITGMQG